MIQLAICDDESYMLKNLSACLSAYMKERGLPYSLTCFSNGKDLLNNSQPFDLVFLDIQMEGVNGLETASLLRKSGYSGLLVFLTVLKECVFDAFEVDANDFLVKPVEDEKLWRTLDRLFAGRWEMKSILIHKGADTQIIPLKEIRYCEVLGRKIYLHTENSGVIDYYQKLKEFEQAVDSRFFRCHRSYLVNLDFVRGLKGGAAKLTDGSVIPISRLREQEFTQALLFYMKQRRR